MLFQKGLGGCPKGPPFVPPPRQVTVGEGAGERAMGRAGRGPSGEGGSEAEAGAEVNGALALPSQMMGKWEPGWLIQGYRGAPNTVCTPGEAQGAQAPQSVRGVEVAAAASWALCPAALRAVRCHVHAAVGQVGVQCSPVAAGTWCRSTPRAPAVAHSALCTVAAISAPHTNWEGHMSPGPLRGRTQH